jgi:hypothetical protein
MAFFRICSFVFILFSLSLKKDTRARDQNYLSANFQLNCWFLLYCILGIFDFCFLDWKSLMASFYVCLHINPHCYPYASEGIKYINCSGYLKYLLFLSFKKMNLIFCCCFLYCFAGNLVWNPLPSCEFWR